MARRDKLLKKIACKSPATNPQINSPQLEFQTPSYSRKPLQHLAQKDI